MNIDKHKERMNANGSIGDSFGNATKNRINNAFKDSPFYKVININGIATEVRVQDQNGSFMFKRIALRPEVKVKLGDICQYDNSTWMVIDFSNNDLFPVGKIQKCNHTLKWQRNSTIHSYPTVVFSRTAYKDDVYPDKVMTLASGQYQLYIANDVNTMSLNIGNRFFIGRDVYEIAYIDEITLNGILVFTLNKSITKNPKDNVELGIADYTDPIDTTPPVNNGGGLW